MANNRRPSRWIVQRRTRLADDFADGDEDWASIAQIWAYKTPLRGAELIAAQQLTEQVTSGMRIRWSPTLADLSAADRLVCGKTRAELVSVVNEDDRNLWLVCQIIEKPHDG